MARTPYKWFNINRIGSGKRVNGKSGKAETTICWQYYSGKCRTVGTYSPRRNHGRATASRQTEKTVDTHDIEEWTGCEYIQLKEMSQDRARWRRKISEWSSAVANHHRGRSTSDWVSDTVYSINVFWITLRIFMCIGPNLTTASALSGKLTPKTNPPIIY